MSNTEGAFLYSPFYPQSGGGSTPSTFKIGSFVSNKPFNEMGVAVTSVKFDWIYLNGVPTSQSIMPVPGAILPNTALSYMLTGQNITETTVFTLYATDGNVSRTLTTRLFFYYPIYFGAVSTAIPLEADILAMSKHIAAYTDFTAVLNLTDEYSCFVSPMTNPIIDIREKIFGFSILGSYNVIDNYYVTMADGFALPCRIMVKKTIEHTMGLDMELDVIF